MPTAAHAVAAALRALGSAMAAARKGHGDAFDALRSHLSFSWTDLNPFALKDKVAQLVDDTLRIYEPASGQTVTVSREQWTSGTMDVGGWGEPWAVVVPSGH